MADIITLQELEKICQYGEAFDNKAGYPAVVFHPDNTISKIWARKKKLLSSATLRPYSDRFIHNGKELASRGIVVPEIVRHMKVKNSHIRVVTYHPISGVSIREQLKKNPKQLDVSSLAQFIYDLHQKGIFFRGIHLGNIIQLTTGKGYGLIDFTDVKFYSKSISNSRRATNLATPLRYLDDIQRIKEAGLPDLLESYLQILQLNEPEIQRFKENVSRHIK